MPTASAARTDASAVADRSVPPADAGGTELAEAMRDMGKRARAAARSLALAAPEQTTQALRVRASRGGRRRG